MLLWCPLIGSRLSVSRISWEPESRQASIGFSLVFHCLRTLLSIRWLSLHCVAQCPGVIFVADKNFWEGSCRRSEQTDGGRGEAGGEDGWTSWGGRGAPRQQWENKTEEHQSSLTRSLFGFRCGCQRLGLMGFSPSRLLFGPPQSRGGPVSGVEGVGCGPRADCPVLLVL